MTERKLVIENVMSDFDFNRVHDVMEYLNWQWAFDGGENFHVPSVDELKEQAEELLTQAYYSLYNDTTGQDEAMIGTGGFTATAFIPDEDIPNKAHIGLELEFTIESAYSETTDMHL